METIHSRSYTHIIKNIYPNPSDVFDTILDEDAIIKRAKWSLRKYDHFIELGRRRLLGLKVDEYELYKALYLALVSVNILEASDFSYHLHVVLHLVNLNLWKGVQRLYHSSPEMRHNTLQHHNIY